MEKLTNISIRLGVIGAVFVAVGSVILLALGDVASAVIGFSGASILGYGAFQAHRYSKRYALQPPRYPQPMTDEPGATEPEGEPQSDVPKAKKAVNERER